MAKLGCTVAYDFWYHGVYLHSNNIVCMRVVSPNRGTITSIKAHVKANRTTQNHKAFLFASDGSYIKCGSVVSVSSTSFAWKTSNISLEIYPGVTYFIAWTSDYYAGGSYPPYLSCDSSGRGDCWYSAPDGNVSTTYSNPSPGIDLESFPPYSNGYDVKLSLYAEYTLIPTEGDFTHVNNITLGNIDTINDISLEDIEKYGGLTKKE